MGRAAGGTVIASVLWSVAVMVVLVACLLVVGLTAYGLGRHRGLLRAQAIVQATAMHPPPIGPMPPERAWVACCERLSRLLSKA